jgi:DNA polymerase
MHLHVDLETASRLDLKKVGIDRYSHDETTTVLMMAYCFDDEPVQLWEPHLGAMPERVAKALVNPLYVKHAWNVGFEFNVISAKLGFDLKINQWFDPAAHARYMAYPGDLLHAGAVLGIDLEYMKSKDGKTLIKLFSMATKAKKPTKKNPDGIPSRFHNWETHPAEWAQFGAYCKQDVEAERAIGKELTKRSPFPAKEHAVWVIDQTINARGIPIDLDFAAKALALVETERAAVMFEMRMKTGCDNPNSPAQIKEWLSSKGMDFASLNKEAVAAALDDDETDETVGEVLGLKQTLGGIAFKKLPVIQNWTRENRLRYAFLYHSAHTGRWSSKGVQFHNLLKPTKRVGENMEAIVQSILTGSPWPEGIPIIEGVSGALRAAVRALEDARLFVADYSSIENRVLAWLAECSGMLDVFTHPTKNDPYKSFAVKMFGITYEAVSKEQRNFCKSPVLGCGFGMGALRLVGYAKQMGQIITEEQAVTLVKAWREAYPEVVEYWDDLGKACIKAVLKRQHLQFGPLRLDGRDEKLFKITLPSGRQLHYDQPQIERDMYHRPVLSHLTEIKKGWYRQQARGSSLVENVVQAIARDLLVNGMMNVIAAGFDIVLHVHDELVAEVKWTSSLTYAMFEECMTKNPTWAPDLPLKVEGYEGPYYHK